jgi:putative acetyltransferase
VLLPDTEIWVATDGDALVAMMSLDGEWVEQLYVAPEHWRRGHGTRLLEVAQGTRTSLSLWTFEANLPARRFYEAHGFTQSGSPSSDNEDRTPAICYRWRAAKAGISLW